MIYTLKTTNVYRVPTVEEALRLRTWLQNNADGELVSFSYTTKYIKAQGQVIEEYQLVKATFDVDTEKEPMGVLTVNINRQEEENVSAF